MYMPLDQFAAYFFKLKQHFKPFFGEKKEDLRKTKKCILARFQLHLGGGLLL